MKIIISPAKKMRVDTDTLDYLQMPQFIEQAEELKEYLQSLSYAQAKNMWRCSDKLAQMNYERLIHMDLRKLLTPAILSYEGIQYQYMAPAVFEEKAFAYIEEHLRILSGFYGMLRPFDGVAPYRLEMQARICFQGKRTLYEYWGSQIADQIFKETDCILNLASKEYSLCVSRYLNEQIRFVTCIFGEYIDGKVKEKGTLCKIARGEMVRYMAEHHVEAVKKFKALGYHFCDEMSDESKYVFVRR